MEIGFELDLGIAADASRGGRIVTGVYKAEIVKAYVYKTTNKNNVIDLEFRSENGEVGFVNRLCIDKKWESGSDNLDYPRWQELAACAGMKTLTTYKLLRKTRDGEVEATGIKELIGKVVNVAVYQEFDAYNNKEVITLKLVNTFLATGQSVAEAQAKKPAERINKTEERLSDFHTAAWKEWKQGGGSVASSQAKAEEVIDEVEMNDIPDAEADSLFG